MADDDKKDPAQPAKDAGSVDESAIRKVVADVLGGLFKGGKADVDDDDDQPKGKRRRGQDDDTDIGAQVDAALQKVAKRDAQTKREQELQDRLKALEEKTATPERVPRQYRKITKLMWGGDDGE